MTSSGATKGRHDAQAVGECAQEPRAAERPGARGERGDEAGEREQVDEVVGEGREVHRRVEQEEGVRDAPGVGGRGGVLDTTLAVAEQVPGVDGVEDVAPHPECGEPGETAEERECERAAAAHEREPDEHREHERGRELRTDPEGGRGAGGQRLEPSVSEQEAGGDGGEGGGDEVVLGGGRLECE